MRHIENSRRTSTTQPSTLATVFLSCLLCLGATLAAISPAEAAPAKGTKVFEDTSSVTLIEVPVNVTNRQGDAVRGLTAEDFEILDNGKPQRIAGLEVVDLETLSPTRAETKRIVERMPAVARRHFLMLFDLSFSRPSSVVKARAAAREFVLEHLHATDLAAVATFSLERGPQLLVTFTPDRAQLARAIDTLGAPELLDRGVSVDPLRFVIDTPGKVDLIDDGLGDSGGRPDIEDAVSQHLSVIAFQQERARKTFERGRIKTWSKSMAETARALATINGRKHVIYFSEGFDGSLLLGRNAAREDSAAMADQRLREANALWLVDQDDTFGSSALQSDVADMLQEFRRADCLIQAVDIAGLRVESSVDGLSGNRVASRLNDSQDALFYVADATGGNLFEDANNLGSQLEDVLERNSITYVLSFYPQDLKLDGKFHKLKVKTTQPRGTRLSHRAGYYAPRSFSDLHPMEKALLASQAIASATPRQDLDLHVLAAPFRASPDLAYVPVILEIGGRSLLAGHKDQNLSLEIYIYATNSQGEMRDFVTQVVSFDLAKAGSLLGETGVKYYGHLDLTPDDYLLRVLVRNGQTGKAAVVSQNIAVPEYAEAAPELLPPFFLEPPNRWFMVREQVGNSQQASSVVYPFTINGQPFIPAARPAMAANQVSQFGLIAYNLGDASIKLDAKVKDGSGAAVEQGELSLIERTVTGIDGLDKVLASFDPQDLGAGDYTLEVAVINAETGSEQLSSIPFRVQ